MDNFLKNKNRTTGAIIFNDKFYVLLLLFISLLYFSACKREKPAESHTDTKSGVATLVPTVEVVHPAQRSFSSKIIITGTTRANRKVMLHAMAGGYLKNIFKDIGDYVKKGETVAILENPDLTNKEKPLRVNMEAKRKIYERLQSIHDKTPALITTQQVEEAEAAYLLAQAELDYLLKQLDFLKVTAPFSGLVTKRFLDEGALVQSGISDADAMPLIEIQQT
ncbi:MAG TPA: hypothetical protein ENJ20_04850, partial [Bacteroidetes bacterium]|nr:hypothetical protein [Bacteroidota bacterium]